MHYLTSTSLRTLWAAGGAVILVLLLLAAGCTGQKSGPALNGMGWTLSGYAQNGAIGPALPGTPVTLAFGSDGSISGSAGCNRYFASWEASGSSLAIGQTGSTMMYCGIPGVMEQESTYLGLLAKAKTFSIRGDQLTLSDASGAPVLTFVRTVPPVAKPLSGTNWTLESIHTGQAISSVVTGTSITAVFGEDGRISGSAGCNRYFAQFSQSGTALTIGVPGSTRMMCPDPEIMKQEQTYLSLLSEVHGYSIEGSTLTLISTSGSAILTFRAEP